VARRNENHQFFDVFQAGWNLDAITGKNEPERLENLLLTARLRCDIIRDFIDTR
jgi:hypothetical protein